MAPRRTLRPADAHARLLRDLGLAPHEVPHDPDERASLFRTLCADRRLLFVLDDARDMAQLRPLLPAGAGCGAIVTSRNRLSSLPGAQDLRLAALPRAQARTLFLQVAGIGPREAEPDAVEAILDCCAGLPLALRIAGARATVGPTRSLRVLADRLADRRHGLAELTVDDLAVQTSYQTTVDCLSTPTAAALPALGCWPGTDLPHAAVAALWDLPERATDTALAELTALHLVEPEGPDRVRTHDLIRRCLEGTAAEQLTEPERRAARGRVLAWYLDRTEAAAAVLADPDASRHGAALDWCEQELPNLLVVAGLADEAGRPAAAALLARSLWAFFDVRKHWPAWLELQQLGLAAAERSGDTEARASLLNGRAAALWGLGRFQEAGADWELAAELYLGTEEPGRAADMFGNLSGALARQELFERAVEVGEQAVAIHRGQPPRPQHAGTLNNLGMVYFAAGRRDEARRCYQDAVELSRALGHRHFEAAALSNLAELATACGDPLAGIAYCTSALALCEEIGSRYGRALTLNNLGQARLATGETGLARQAWASALEILEDLGDPHAESVRASIARTAPVARRGDDPDRSREAGPSTA
jgi:tetratricopeptide (TPR) repeat protein